MSLPDAWVEKIFQKLSVTYGAAFLRKYEGVPLDDVKADWAGVLAGFQQKPTAIRYALENLEPGKVPDALQFREMCRRSPPEPTVKIEGPAPDPARVAAVLAAAQAVVAPRRARMMAPLQWAIDMQEREKQGDRTLSDFQRKAWREALRVES